MVQQVIRIFLRTDDDASRLNCSERIFFRVFNVGQSKIKLEPEIASLTLNTLESYLSSHELNQLLANGGPQTSSSVASRGRFFSLRKAVEYPALRFEWNAYPRIFYRKSQADRVWRLEQQPYGQTYSPLLGKLD